MCSFSKGVEITLLLVAVLCTGSTPAQDKVAEDAAPQGKGKNSAFVHTEHVSPQWLLSEEVERDCRGCHRYQEGHDPTTVTCEGCHYIKGQRTIETPPGFQFSSLRDEASPFLHKFHLSLECKECHNPSTPKVWGGEPEKLSTTTEIPGDMPIPKGAGVCMRCHNPMGSKPFPKAIERDILMGHLESLDQSPRMGPGGFRGFSHTDHMSVHDLNSPERCAECHSSVAKADVSALWENQFTVDSCAPCHVTAKAPLGFEFSEVRHQSRAALCFPHGPHLGAKALEDDESLRTKRCLACHVFDRKTSTYRVLESFDQYEGCVQCHAHESWKVADHGEVDDCGGCHSVGQGSMKENRPTVEVERPRPTAFRILQQVHPFITDKKGNRKECAQCHVAGLEELPSRIGEKKFTHKAHLPDAPTEEDCKTCHDEAVAKTKSSADITTTYNSDRCKDCHRGKAKIEPVLPAKAKKRRVNVFSHADHLAAPGAQGEPYTCLTCHDASNPNADIGTKPRALDCSECHDHDENAPVTSGKDRAYIDNCIRCHASGVPQKDEPVFVTRQLIGNVVGSQHHPFGRDCTDCHSRPLEELTRVVTEHEDHFTGKQLSFVDFHFIRTDGPNATPPWSDCFCCHWGQQMERRRPGRHQDTPVKEIRRLLGDKIEGYPGKGCAEQ
jgi:hypothetical protein